MSFSSKWQEVREATKEDWRKASKKRKTYLVLVGYPIMTIPVLSILLAVFLIGVIIIGLGYLVRGFIAMFQHPAFLGFCLLLIAIALFIILSRV